jgi:hypothetical protein
VILVLATMELVAHDTHAYEMHAYEMHPLERHPHEMHAMRYMACERGTSWEALHKRYAPVRDACPRDACPPEMHAYERHRRACVRRFPTPDAPMKEPRNGAHPKRTRPYLERGTALACPPHAVGTNLFHNGS